MRVIAGKARRTTLSTVEGTETRPTTDRIKETLFNMINSEIYDCKFLDLYSGSGAIGIEALSRGAAKCIFVENNKKASECIKNNLKKTKLDNQAIIIEKDVIIGIKMIKPEKFDIIFMDPPYKLNEEEAVLAQIRESEIIDENTIIIIEAELEKKFDFVKKIGYKIVKEKQYKTNKHIFVCIDKEDNV